jgi:dihydrofolate reductase
MAKLIYLTPASLDGWIADPSAGFAWSAPDAEVFAFYQDQLDPIGTYLYGRKMYETMAVWQSPEVLPGLTPAMRDFARTWQAAEKIVYSRTLAAAGTPATALKRDFDPRAVLALKAESPRDVTVGGPNLAAQAIRAGLVDEVRLVIVPMLLGGGIRILPAAVRAGLELLEERRFAAGAVYLRYRLRAPAA